MSVLRDHDLHHPRPAADVPSVARTDSTALAAPAPPAVSRPEPMEGAYKCLLLFVLVYCARPEDWIPGIGLLPLAKITGIFALVAFALSIRFSKGGFRLPKEMVYLGLLVGQFFLAALLSTVWRGGAVKVAFDFSKVALIVVVASLTVTTVARLRKLLFVQVACVAAVAVVALVKGQYGRTERLEGVVSGIYDNSNDLALAIVLAMPFCFGFLMRTRNAFKKSVWALVMAMMSYALLLTASRSGLLTMLIAASVCLWEFGVKQKRLHLLVAAGVVGMALLLIGGGRLKARIDATLHPGTENSAYESAEQRKELLVHSLQVTLAHPLFGVGPGDFAVLSGNWHEVHNMYTQISSEAGVPALLLFLMIFGRTFSNLRKTMQLAKEQPELRLWAGVLYADVCAFAVGSFFSPIAYHFFPYFLVAYATALFGMASSLHHSQAEPEPVPQAGRSARETRRGLQSKVAGPAY